jgi:uncharacterized protein YcbK (DUF882 family)
MPLDGSSPLYNLARAYSLVCKVIILRELYSFSVTSWFRSEARNALVGGLPKSLHKKGLAIDVVLDSDVSLKDFKADAEILGLYVYNEGDHLHLYEV